MRERLLRAEVGSPLGDLRSEVACARRPCRTRPGVTISTLRGQFADNHEWDLDAVAAGDHCRDGRYDRQPAALLRLRRLGAASAQLARRACSRRISLIVIDEAHLSPAFAQTLISIREQRPLQGSSSV